jgi:hypothetical protein
MRSVSSSRRPAISSPRHSSPCAPRNTVDPSHPGRRPPLMRSHRFCYVSWERSLRALPRVCPAAASSQSEGACMHARRGRLRR